MSGADDEVEWLKLPHDLQYKFFEEAEKEAGRIVNVVERLQRTVLELKRKIVPLVEDLSEHDRVFRVAAIDGSRSPRLSERLGVRYGVFSVGVVILEGMKRIYEGYEAGQFKRKQAFSQEVSKYFFNLLSIYAERKAAVEVLNRLEDGFLMIDGSFYGFIYSALRMRKQGFFGEREGTLFEETCQLTNRLVESERVMGVIKRSHTRAIGGWLALRNKDLVGRIDSPVTIIDKLLLSMIMPSNTILRYERITGDDPVYVYTQLAYMAHRGIWPETPLEVARERVYEPYRVLGMDESLVKKLRRLQVRKFPEAPTCEVEYPSSIPIDRLKLWLGQKNFFNKTTGLPFTIDMVDSLISLSPEFTEEYVSEIEARALSKAYGIISPEVLRWFFNLLNPQKGV